MKLRLPAKAHGLLASVLTVMRPLPQGGTDFDRALQTHLAAGRIAPKAADDLSAIAAGMAGAPVPDIEGKIGLMERYAKGIDDVLATAYKGDEEQSFELDDDLGQRVADELRRVVDGGQISGANIGPMLRLLRETTRTVPVPSAEESPKDTP